MPRGVYDREAAKQRRLLREQDTEDEVLAVEEPQPSATGFQRCTTCYGTGHTAENCTKFVVGVKPAFKRRCPLCFTAVSQEEFEMHRDYGCANLNAPVVRLHDDHSRLSH